jgi:uncharacterized protein
VSRSIALIALRVSRRTPGPVVRALSALGQRSLSGYLFQSVAWLVLTGPAERLLRRLTYGRR